MLAGAAATSSPYSGGASRAVVCDLWRCANAIFQKHSTGQVERIHLLERQGLLPRKVLAELYQYTRKTLVQVDDVLDAMVLYLLGLSSPQPLMAESIIDSFGLTVNYQMPTARLAGLDRSD